MKNINDIRKDRFFVPVIIQDHSTKIIYMLGYMNHEAYTKH